MSGSSGPCGRAGVREYWMVDPDFNVLTIVRRAADGSFPMASRLADRARDVRTTPPAGLLVAPRRSVRVIAGRLDTEFATSA
jgi:hypothetical protein